MKIAISTWSGRVSPVLDVAKNFLLVDAKRSVELARRDVAVEEAELSARAKRIAALCPDVLICGGISRPFEAMLHSAGIRLIPHTCGPVEDVLRAFLTGQLTEQAFLMPGCCGRRRRFRGGCVGGRGGRASGGGTRGDSQ
jgi:predicted Fe-Mo cluster-binding NifX family protein